MPSTSIIIAFYNRIDFLRLVFASLERQTFDNFEIIIADDGSDETVEKQVEKLCYSAPFPTQYLWQEDLGFRKNRIFNRAITATQSPYLIFIDGDCILHKNFIKEHYENRRTNVCLTGRRVNLSDKISRRLTPQKVKNGYLETHFLQILLDSIWGKSRYAEKGLYFSNPLLRRFINKKVRTLLGCNFSLHKSDILAVNGFDERYELPSIGEDTDLEYRLGLNGVKTRSLNNIAIQYHLYHEKQPRSQKNLDLFAKIRALNNSHTPFGITQDNSATLNRKLSKLEISKKPEHVKKNHIFYHDLHCHFNSL